MSNYETLVEKYRTITTIQETLELLHWDQQVMMPEEGIRARSKQVSILSKISHQRLASPEIGDLIEAAETSKEGEDAVVREISREHTKSKKVSRDLIEKISQKETEALDAWQKAKEEGDFRIFQGPLKEMVELKREYADQIDPDREPYRVLFDDYEPYIRFETMNEILETLRTELSSYLENIREEGKEIETEAFRGDFDRDKQEELSRKIAGDIGYNWKRGRLDSSAHPFTSGSQFDARITTRYSDENLQESILPTIHETGHAMYQQGLPDEHYGTPLGQARDLSVHESQSRLWENHVGRSKEFQEYLLPILEERFPGQFEDTSVQDCYESVSQVYERNPIRVNADELTYHLHIILRYELERGLINGDIEVENLPERWNGKMENLLGFAPESDAEGVLQDVHWSQGAIGYFSTYTLGSVIAAQLFDSAKSDIDDLDQKIADGTFEELLEWLRENIHEHGQRYRTEELVERATGEKPTADYFLKYIRGKYSELYDVELG